MSLGGESEKQRLPPPSLPPLWCPWARPINPTCSSGAAQWPEDQTVGVLSSFQVGMWFAKRRALSQWNSSVWMKAAKIIERKWLVWTRLTLWDRLMLQLSSVRLSTVACLGGWVITFHGSVVQLTKLIWLGALIMLVSATYSNHITSAPLRAWCRMSYVTHQPRLPAPLGITQSRSTRADLNMSDGSNCGRTWS